MKRRDVLKGAAVAAGTAVVGLPAEAEGLGAPLGSEACRPHDRRSSVLLFIQPDEEGKLAGPFQKLFEGWEEADRGHFRPTGKLTFDIRMEDGSPWLVHPAWEPPSEDNLATLHTPTRNIYRDRRWDLIERAVNLRERGYWNQEYGPQWEAYQAHPNGLDGGGCSPAYSHLCMFRRVTRKRLHRVLVRFDAVPVAGLGPEHVRLESKLDVLERLRRADKLTVRTYYQRRNAILDQLEEIEDAFG